MALLASPSGYWAWIDSLVGGQFLPGLLCLLSDLVVGYLPPCFLWECRGGVGLAHPFLSLVCVPYDVRPPGVASRLPLGPHISLSWVRPPLWCGWAPMAIGFIPLRTS